jgi:deoxyribonuclease-4
MKTKHQRIGLHVSAAGGVENAPENAKEFGAECFQFFSRSPRGGPAKPISDEQAKLFRERSKQYGFESYIHTPYYINFASKNNKIYYGSITAVREELIRGSKLGVKYVMTHMGSARDWQTPPNLPLSGEEKQTPPDKGEKEGVSRVPPEAIKHAIVGLKKIFETKEKLTTQLLLEISAGAGAVLGDSFEELATLLDGLGRDDVGICLDTCHMFASGCDLRTKQGIDETMKAFKKHLGLKRLKLVHVNDSKTEFAGRRDRHEHIGHGYIGEAGFKALLHHPAFQKTNFILETEHDKLIHDDLTFLKKHRAAKA